MNLFKNRSGAIKGAMVILTLAFVIASVSYIIPVLATHDSTAELQPEWSPPNQEVDYSVEICNYHINDGGEDVDEVRIYMNPYYTYVTPPSGKPCDEKEGWELLWIEAKQACQYVAKSEGYYIEPDECQTFYFTATTPAEGCEFVWDFETRDVTDPDPGSINYLSDTTSVDDVAPVIIKTLGEPKIENGETWITYDTQIRIEFYDEGVCGISGLDYCDYRYNIDDDTSMPWTRIQWQRVKLGVPPHYFFNFTYDEDSEHFLEIRCYDVAGNMAYHSQTDKVDDTPPVTTKDVSEPKKIDGLLEWVDTTTIITLNPTDPDPTQHQCNVGVDKTWYRNDWYTDEHLGSTGCYEPASCNPEFYSEFFDLRTPYEMEEYEGCIDYWQEECLYAGPHGSTEWFDCMDFGLDEDCDVTGWKLYRPGEEISKPDESCHILSFFSVDYLGNTEGINMNCFFVDKTPPKMIKEIGEPNYGYCPTGDPTGDVNGDNDGECWVRDDTYMGGTPITLDCDDSWDGQAQHPSGDEEVCYKVSLDSSDYTDPYCPEALEYIEQPEHEGWWCCVDGPKEIIFHEDTLHDLEWFCRDAVDKKSEIDLEWFRVDSLPPIIEKDMFGSYLGDCPSGTDIEHGDCYVADDGSSGVDITVYDDDTYPECAVDELYCYYDLIWILPTGERIVIEEGYEFSTQAKIIFTEDSTHELYIYCEDALGNYIEDTEFFLVDSTPPETEKEYGTPTEVERGYRWINSSTSITLTPSEDEKVGLDKTYWRNTLLDIPDDACLEQCQCESPLEEVFDLTGDVEGTITKTDDGDSITWTIEITSPSPVHHRWAVGMPFATNTSMPAFQVWYREYEEPYGWYYQEYTGTGWHGWGGDIIALPTEGITATGDHTGQVFTITVPKNKLGGPCETFYWATQARTNLLGKYPETWTPWAGGSDEVSGMANSMTGGLGDWNEYIDPFTKPDESCHLIEYYSVDLLGNEEDIRWQCVFVDNTPPEVNKTITGIKEEWEGDDTFYENLIARCAAGDIECWKVTLGTKLSLECSEPTHSVDRNHMCFQIELDGKDVTQDYCDSYSGEPFNYDLEMSDGWCCGEGIGEFHFLEESQHDLKVKCIDNLYESEVDEEKFKVEGCPFDICLNKKWNLISVPFTLFNDDPDVVFEDVKEDIVSVWMYDPSQCGGDGWCVWTPDGGGGLDIKPGWGYWVLSKEDGVCFEVAGSLISPKEVPPSRTLQPSWNLIGYYGNTGFNNEWWFQCHDFDECYIPDRPVYCALNSLVDTQIGFPRWSSLYTYYNEGDDDAYWDGLDACVGMFWGTEYMEPGQGYWIEMDVADGYAPATNCIWNTELICVPEWPY